MKKLLLAPLFSLGLIISTGAVAQNVCDVSYVSPNNWGTGAQEDLILTNRGAAKTGWELCWTFKGNEVVTTLWNGTYTMSGRKICVKNTSFNASLPTNGSAAFGFTHDNLPGAKPTDFTLNGTSCAGGVASSAASTPPSSLPSGSGVTVQAESYSAMNGLQTEATTDTGGGQNVGWIDAGDWATYNDVNLPCSGSYLVEYRVASQSSGGQIALEKAGGSATFGTLNFTASGGWQTWKTVSHTVTLPAGNMQFGIAMKQGGWNFNWFKVTPMCMGGVSSSAAPSSVPASSVKSSVAPSSIPASSVKSSIAPSSIASSIRSSSVPIPSSIASSFASSSLRSSVAASIVPGSGWVLSPDESYLNFVTTKKIHTAEVQAFDRLSGGISAAGVATLSIDLNSVNTNNTVRDDRIRTMLFEIVNFPNATVTVALPAGTTSNLVVGQTSKIDITANLNLHGVTLPLATTVSVQKLTATRVLVKSMSPILIKASDYGLAAGVEALRAIMAIDSISNIVPVDFALVFDGSDTGIPLSSSPTQSVPSMSSSSSSTGTVNEGKNLFTSAALGCMGCHGANGTGGIAVIDPNKASYGGTTLAAYITANMPKGNVGACNADCGTKIAAYIKSWVATSSSSASSTAVSACPAGSTICENFDSANVGAIPAGWNGTGARVPSVTNTLARSGTKSLKVSAFDFGQSGYIQRGTIPAAHYGRIFYRLDRLTAADYLHIPLVVLKSTNDGQDLRIVDLNSSQAGAASLDNLKYLIGNPADQGVGGDVFTSFKAAQSAWQCVEWRSDPATQTYTVWVNDIQRVVYKTNNLIPGGNYSSINVGMQTFRGSEESAWIDDVVVAPSRIGCN